MGTYYVSMTDEKNKIVGIEYKNSQTDSGGMFRLMKAVQHKTGGSITKENEIYILKGGSPCFGFWWEKGKGMQVQLLEKEAHFRWQDTVLGDCMRELNDKDNQKIVDEINAFLKNYAWFDFSILEYASTDLHIIGSTDLSYYYELEVIFENASFILCSSDWHTSPSEETVFSLAQESDFLFINQYAIDCGYSTLVKIKSEDSDKFFYIGCYGIQYCAKLVPYRNEYEQKEEKEKIVKKYSLFLENGGWYQQKENSHKCLIFKDSFYQYNDVIGLLFRIYKLCFAKVTYFRKNIEQFEPYKYDYQKGFLKTGLWDSEFLKHKASGYLLDYRYLQSITMYADFLKLTKELEHFEAKTEE